MRPRLQPIEESRSHSVPFFIIGNNSNRVNLTMAVTFCAIVLGIQNNKHSFKFEEVIIGWQ